MTAFGGYELVRRIGAGAMGEVWEAHDIRLGRPAAVKILKRAGDDERARFKREARLASRLTHPNIATLFEVGEADGRPFIAMQKVDGVPLGRDALPLRRRIEALRDAARAVHFAHARGIVHRDLKPENILIDGEGRAVVLDFGLARTLGADAEDPIPSSISGHVVGTPPYMPPEQARGRLHDLDARADVYGLGAVLYFLLAGRPPFEGRTDLETLADVVARDPSPPPGDRDLGTVALKALEKNRERRYASAEDFAAELDRWLAGRPILAKPPNVVDRIRKHVRREPVLWSLAILLGATSVTGAGWGIRAFLGRRAALESQVAAEQRAKDAEARAAASLALAAEMEAASEKLDEFDAALARRMDAGDLEAVRAGIRVLIFLLDGQIRKYPAEGGLYYLKGRAHRMLEDDGPALAALLQVPGRDETDWGRASHVRSLAAYERFLLYANGLIDEKSDVRSGDTVANDAAAREKWLPKMRKERDVIDPLHLPFQDRAAFEIWECLIDGKLGPAVEASEAAVRCGGPTARLRLVRAFVYLDAGRIEEAVADVDAAIDRHHGIARAHFLKGLAETVAGRPDRARKGYEEALRLRPGYDRAHCRLGLLLIDFNECEAALAHFNEAVGRVPEDATYRVARSKAFGALGRADEQLADLRAAVSIDPDSMIALFNLGTVLYNRRDFKGALGAYSDAIERNPRKTPQDLSHLSGALYGRGLTHDTLGDPRRALEDFDESLKLEPMDEAFNARGDAHAGLDAWAAAEADYGQAIRMTPAEPRFLFNRARARERLKQFDGAIEDLERALKVAPAGWPKRPSAEALLEQCRRRRGGAEY